MAFEDLTTSIDAFVELLHADCPGAPDILKKRAIRGAAMEFFRKTRGWREYIPSALSFDAVTAEADVNGISVLEDNVSVLDVDDAWIAGGGNRLHKHHRVKLDHDSPKWRSHTTNSEPTGYLMATKRRLRIYPALSADAGTVALDLELILLPSMNSDLFPDHAYDIYGEGIAAGALQRLKTQPGKAWSDPEQAGFFMKKFQYWITEAKAERAMHAVRAINERRRTAYR